MKVRDFLQMIVPPPERATHPLFRRSTGSPSTDRQSPAVVLDVGCGNVKRPGSIGVDLLALPGVDVVGDFMRLPFRDSSVDGIYTSHTLEHTDNLLGAMEEFWRICKPSGLVYVRGPHASCPYVTWSDPTHRRGLTLETFRYFDEHHYFNFYTHARFTIAQAWLYFTTASHRPQQRWPRRLATRLLEALANASQAAQYRCERWWGPLIGIEEVHVLLRAIK